MHCRKLTIALTLIFAFFMAAAPAVAGAAAVSLEYRDVSVREIFTQLAEIGGFSLVMDASVNGRATVSLHDADPVDAARIVAAATGLYLEERGGVVVVANYAAGRRNLRGVHVFKLQFAELAAVAEAVEAAFSDDDEDNGFYRYRGGYRPRGEDYRRDSRAVAADGGYREDGGANGGGVYYADGARRRRYRDSYDDERRTAADPLTNSLLFFGTAQEAAEAAKIVAALDASCPQVSLEARVVAINKDAAKNLGVEWQWSSLPQYPERKTTYETRRQTVQNPDGSYATVSVDVPTTEVARQWQGGPGSYGAVKFGRGPEGHPLEFYYAATINALVTGGKAKILARPNITTLQGKEAVINIGGRVPITETSVTNSTSTTSVTYQDAGIILRCTPRLNGDGTITAAVHTEVSSPVYVAEMKAYRFQTRSADTAVRLKDGETMVIGGLIGSEEAKSWSKVPLLGDLPIIGAFFRSSRRQKADNEIMIFLTARALDEKTAKETTQAAEDRLNAYLDGNAKGKK